MIGLFILKPVKRDVNV